MVKNSIKSLGIFIIVIGLALFIAKDSNPDFLPFYSLKRLEEKAIGYSKISPQDKAIYMESLLNKRHEELQYIVSNKKYDSFLQTSLRFSTTAGNLTDYIIANNLKDRIPHVQWVFWHHKTVIEKLMKEHDDNERWKFIQDDINYLRIYSEKLAKVK